MDITTKKGRRGRKDIDRIIVEKGRRGDFSPLQPDHYHSFYEIFYFSDSAYVFSSSKLQLPTNVYEQPSLTQNNV